MRSEKPDRWGKTEGKREGKVVTGKKKKKSDFLDFQRPNKNVFWLFLGKSILNSPPLFIYLT